MTQHVYPMGDTHAHGSTQRRRGPASFLFEGRTINTFHAEDGWRNQRTGSEHPISTHADRQQAIDEADAIATREGVDHVVYSRGGSVHYRTMEVPIAERIVAACAKGAK